MIEDRHAENVLRLIEKSKSNWGELMRDIRARFCEYMNRGFSPADSVMLGMADGAGGLQFYVPKPETMKHRPTQIESRTRPQITEATLAGLKRDISELAKLHPHGHIPNECYADLSHKFDASKVTVQGIARQVRRELGIRPTRPSKKAENP